MATQKTLPTGESVTAYIEQLENEKRREEAYTLLDLIGKVTGYKGVMWGPSIIGFGEYTYTYASGHSGTSFLFGFSPRKKSISLYTATGDQGIEKLLSRLGKHRMGKACLYVNHLNDIDLDVLKEIILHSMKFLRDRYGSSDN